MFTWSVSKVMGQKAQDQKKVFLERLRNSTLSDPLSVLSQYQGVASMLS